MSRLFDFYGPQLHEPCPYCGRILTQFDVTREREKGTNGAGAAVLDVEYWCPCKVRIVKRYSVNGFV